MDNQITLLAKDSQLDESTALSLQDKFLPFLEQAEQRKADALAIVVTDASQKDAMQMARTMRLEIKKFRWIVEATRKDLKEESLRKWQAIDKVANIIKSIVEPIEEYLEKQEKFAEIQEANRKAELKLKRLDLLAPYEVNPELLAMVKLEDMTDEQFDIYLKEAETSYKLRKEEEARQAKEAQEKEAENQRIRDENARLQAENQAKEQELAKVEQEKREAEAKQRAEEEAKQKLQQDTAYRNFLAANWCTEETKDQFTTKRAEDWTIILYKKIAEYRPFQDINPLCWF